jgi:Rhs element Vgr protein
MHLQSATPLPDAELKIWADAQLLKSRMARVRGQVTFRGNARPAPGCLVELDGLGERFNGQAFVSRVVHYIDDGNWRTELGFGMAPGWFVEETPAVAAPLASGMLPGISGLQIGVVRKIDADPDGQTRVQVDVPMVGATGEGIWARLASAYATAEAGIFFVPEPGDEVVLGFLNGNPSFPVVLGSLYSSKHTPPYAADAPNTNKAIVTKGKLKISFEDVEHRIRIETPDKRVITLDDKAKTLTLSDGANTVELAQGGITMTSKGDIRIEAGGSLTLKAEVAVAVGAPRVDLKADAAMTLKGEGSVELGSSGKATVQAPLVMIN